MAQNFIRVKQINQAELSGYIAYIAGTGLTATAFVTYTGENIVYNTGDQIISGNKTFVNNVNISGTGTLGGLNLDNINNLLLSGMTINITGNSIVNIFNTVRISGNPVLTGVTQDSRAVLTSTNQTIAGTKTFSTSIVTNLIDGVDTINLGAPPLVISGGNELYVNKKGGDVNIVGGHRSGVINLLSDTNISGNLKINNTGVVDIGNSQLINAVPQFINQTANFVISGDDNGRIIFANSATQITGTIVSGNVTGFNTSIIQVGNGQVQITGSGIGIVVNSYNNQFKTAGQFGVVSLLHTGNNRYIMYGNIV